MPFTVIYRAKIVSCPSHFTLDHTKWSVFIIWQWLVLDISSTNDKWQILGILSSSKPSSNIHLKWDKSLINIQCETSTLFIFFSWGFSRNVCGPDAFNSEFVPLPYYHFTLLQWLVFSPTNFLFIISLLQRNQLKITVITSIFELKENYNIANNLNFNLLNILEHFQQVPFSNNLHQLSRCFFLTSLKFHFSNSTFFIVQDKFTFNLYSILGSGTNCKSKIIH